MQCFQTYFFGESVDPFYLNLTCGLIKDNEIKDEELKLYKYDWVYFPDNFYYNCDPIPIEWLELFEDRNDIISIYEKDDVLNKIGVNPFSSKKELDYMAVQPYMLGDSNMHEYKKGKDKENQIDEILDESKDDR